MAERFGSKWPIGAFRYECHHQGPNCLDAHNSAGRRPSALSLQSGAAIPSYRQHPYAGRSLASLPGDKAWTQPLLGFTEYRIREPLNYPHFLPVSKTAEWLHF
ncbi:MAG: hypothetical protein N2110_04090 [Flavobacteriales bacterium]|nr:hypothetical protein [Flavobacteriales bacterium]MCX7768189.1 hypothetical protein [Flavobacteriales bacterium]MDW8409140.1 hypothetical protein [Flavobacteriales bacterium]